MPKIQPSTRAIDLATSAYDELAPTALTEMNIEPNCLLKADIPVDRTVRLIDPISPIPQCDTRIYLNAFLPLRRSREWKRRYPFSGTMQINIYVKYPPEISVERLNPKRAYCSRPHPMNIVRTIPSKIWLGTNVTKDQAIRAIASRIHLALTDIDLIIEACKITDRINNRIKLIVRAVEEPGFDYLCWRAIVTDNNTGRPIRCLRHDHWNCLCFIDAWAKWAVKVHLRGRLQTTNYGVIFGVCGNNSGPKNITDSLSVLLPRVHELENAINNELSKPEVMKIIAVKNLVGKDGDS